MEELGSASSIKFQGWMAFDKNAIENGLKIESFKPKKWEETDVDVRVTHCGVCFSDICSLRSGWVRLPSLPRLFMLTHFVYHRELVSILAASAMKSLARW